MSFGLVKHNNNSISAITTAGQLASGKLVLIKEQTASSSSSISFVDGSGGVVLDNTYPIYIFKFINMHPATDAAQFSFQGSTNTGGAYGVTITSTHFSAYHNEAGDTTNLGYDGTGNRDLAQSTNFQVLASMGKRDIRRILSSSAYKDWEQGGSNQYGLSDFNSSTDADYDEWIDRHFDEAESISKIVATIMAEYYHNASQYYWVY